MCTAIGAEPRLRRLRLSLLAKPAGLFAERYSASSVTLRQLLTLLLAGCRTRGKAVKPEEIVKLRKSSTGQQEKQSDSYTP